MRKAAAPLPRTETASIFGFEFKYGMRAKNAASSRLSAFGHFVVDNFQLQEFTFEAFKNLLLRNFIAHFVARFTNPVISLAEGCRSCATANFFSLE
jgi:hypothetical protein